MITHDLPDSFEQLVAFGQRPDVKIRPVLLRVLVDMFVSKAHHSASDLAQFEEMMVHLLDDADDETRLIVAEKLSTNPHTPPALLNRFLAERGEIAARVLSQAPVDCRALNAAAVFGTPAMARAVAGRPDLDRTIVRSLAERPEVDVLSALIENPSAPIERSLFRYLARRAAILPELAAKLAERGDTTGEATTLFLSATPMRRAELIADARRRELGLPPRPAPIVPNFDAIASIARASFIPGLEGLDAALAAALDLPASDIERLMDDRHGEPLALALAALGISPETAARIFILGDPMIGRSFQRVRDLVRVSETVPAAAAYKLVMSMLGRSVEAPRQARARPHIADAGSGRVEATAYRSPSSVMPVAFKGSGSR